MRLQVPLSLCIAMASGAFAQTVNRTAKQTPNQTATIRIDPTRIENRISPRLYAAFVEMMAEDVKRGLTAEMLRDRSFEEAPDYLGLPAGWQLEPDERNDNVGAIRFAPVTDESYPASNAATKAKEHALRITLAPADIIDTRRGLAQGRLSVRANETYNGYIWLKLPAKQAYRGSIAVALEADDTDGATYATTTLTPGPGAGWQQLRFALTPRQTDRFSKLSLLFPGSGTLFLDQLSLEPAGARREVRADSEAMIAALHPSFIRWPGGNVAQDYHWQWGIGPRDLRPVWINKSWSNAPEPNDLGTDEYLALCERLHTEPSITVNVEGAGATAEEAANWVEYVNGPATSKFGAMRARNGHPAPYNVKQWELGNEVFGGWVRGHATAEVYAQSAVRYARAMRAVDPSIRLIAVGEGILKDQDDWNSTVLRIAGPEIDDLAIHDYTSAAENTSRAQMLARPAKFEASYRHTAELIARLAPGRAIHQIVNEWNLFYDAGVIQGMDGAVYAARMMNGFERDGDVVEATAISDLLNGWVGGVIQASRDRVYGTAQFFAVTMYADALGTERLHTDTASPELAPGVPSIDAVATRSATGRDLSVKLSNADADHAVTATVELPGLAHAPLAHLRLLARSATHADRNTFANPDAINPIERTLRCTQTCRIDLPPDSVAVLTITAARP